MFNILLCSNIRIKIDSDHLEYYAVEDQGCPQNWYPFENKCYNFVQDDKRIADEADAACWVNGASLLSINTVTEHQFISQWLSKHDFNTNVWHTSGVYYNGVINWKGDSTIYNGPSFWNKNPNPWAQSHIVYAFEGRVDGYGWSLIDNSLKANYICEVEKSAASNFAIQSRDFDYGLGLVSIDAVPRGPKIIQEPGSVIIVGEGVTSVYLECIAKGIPYPAYKWYRGTGLNQSVTSSTDNRYTLSGGRLTIEKPSNNLDFNTYRCTVENEFGTVMSESAQVLFGYLYNFPPVKPEDIVAKQFDGTKMQCTAPSALPAVRYEWFWNSLNGFIFPEHPYMFVSNSGLLYFSEVQLTDEKKYYCIVTLTAPAEYNMATYQPPSRTSLPIWLRVTGYRVGDFGPIIHTHIFPTPALRGGIIRLECIAYGTLPLYYSWKRANGQPFSEGTELSDLNRVLTIKNAQLDSEGAYLCECTRAQAYAATNITLVLESRPYFPFSLRDMHVDPDKSVSFRCKAVARPAPTYTWYKNGILLQNIPGEIEIQQNYLLIKSVKNRHEGMYQCAATNVYGTAYSTAQLRVLSFLPNFNKYPLPTETLAPQGGNITIPCSVEGAPAPEVVWLKNGANMNLVVGDVNNRIYMSFNNGLVLTDIQPADQATYTCQATNAIGVATNTTSVMVIGGITLSTPPTNQQVIVNSTAFLYCQASYDYKTYDLVYLWTFNGYPVDFDDSLHYVQSSQNGLNGLYVREAQIKHMGQYTCIAKTTLHTVEQGAYLDVMGPPGEPAGVYVDQQSVTATSASIIWTVGAEYGDPVVFFIIEGETDYYKGQWTVLKTDIPAQDTVQGVGGILRSDQRVYLVDNLMPNTGYSFRVSAVNKFGAGRPSVGSAVIKTPPTAPVIAPKQVYGGGGSEGTLTVKWEPLDISEESGSGLGYNVYWRRKQEDTGDGVDRGDNWMKGQVNSNTGQYVYLVGLENYYLEYEVKVGAFNDYGAGPNSSVEVIFSAEAMPVARPVMQDGDGFNCTAVWTYWDPVPDTRESVKGSIRGYQIVYYQQVVPELIKTVYTWGQTGECLLIGLEQNNNWLIAVQVMNHAGVGPIGEWRLSESKHWAPRLYPRHVKVFSHGPNSVRVTWQQIDTRWDEESLEGYVLKHWKATDDIRTAVETKVGVVWETILEGIQSNEVYKLRILGWSRGGEGAKSPSVYFTLGGSVNIDPSTSEYIYPGYEGHCSHLSFSHVLLIFSSLSYIAIHFILTIQMYS
ncbi:hypothetical protein ACJMK2_008096 [Sinanodonta woodiana]|uniref:Contactin n=1 Tax=Sinanodonta woodiana TaxID=1069815 RepID=A0ABD3VN16_SINWO